MGGPPFQNTMLWALAAAPLGLLAAAGLLSDVPGEWSRAALLAYAAVLLGLLTGIGSASGALPVLGTSLLALGGLFRRLRGAQPGRCPGALASVIAMVRDQL